jgi:hypothetical protein
MAWTIARSKRLRLLTRVRIRRHFYRSNSLLKIKKTRTTEDLKLNFKKEIATNSTTMLKRVVQNFQKSLREILTQDIISQTLYSGTEYYI